MQIPPSLLYVVAFGFALGVGVGFFSTINFSLLIWIALMMSVLFFISCFLYTREKINLQFLLAIVFVWMLVVGISDTQHTYYQRAHTTLTNYENKYVQVEGVVVDDVDAYEGVSQVHLACQKLYHATSTVALSEEVVVSSMTFPHLSYGDLVRVRGVIKSPESFTTDQGREFNYKNYLYAYGVSMQIERAQVDVISHHHGARIVEWILNLKNFLIGYIKRNLPEPHASLAVGILLGSGAHFAQKEVEMFRTTGLVHIMVASGYNVSIIVGVLAGIGLLISRRMSYVLGIAGILLFLVITGGGTTVLRASLMAGLLMLAGSQGRIYNASRALTFVFLLMLVINPFLLLYDPSFELSFLATVGIIHVSPRVEKHISRRVPAWIREIIATTIGTQITVLPLIIYLTGKMSLVGLFTNLFVLPIVPITMLLCFILGSTSFLGTIVSLPISFLTYTSLSYILAVARFGAHVPFASVRVTLLWVIFFYGSGGVYLWMKRRRI